MQQVIIDYEEKRIVLPDENLELPQKDAPIARMLEALGVDSNTKIIVKGFDFSDIPRIIDLIDGGEFIPFASAANIHSAKLIFKNEKTELQLEAYNSIASALIKEANLAVVFFSKKYYEENRENYKNLRQNNNPMPSDEAEGWAEKTRLLEDIKAAQERRMEDFHMGTNTHDETKESVEVMRQKLIDYDYKHNMGVAYGFECYDDVEKHYKERTEESIEREYEAVIQRKENTKMALPKIQIADYQDMILEQHGKRVLESFNAHKDRYSEDMTASSFATKILLEEFLKEALLDEEGYKRAETISPKFKVGDSVDFVNDYGVVFEGLNITEVKIARKGYEYRVTPAEFSWTFKREENLHPAGTYVKKCKDLSLKNGMSAEYTHVDSQGNSVYKIQVNEDIARVVVLLDGMLYTCEGDWEEPGFPLEESFQPLKANPEVLFSDAEDEATRLVSRKLS